MRTTMDELLAGNLHSGGDTTVGEQILGAISGLPDQQQQLIPRASQTTAAAHDEDEDYNWVAYDNDLTNKRDSSKRRRKRLDSEAHELALEKAKQLLTSLSTKHPSFIKQIQWSHVNVIYKLGVPVEFCKSHLPKHHEDVILEDESGESYQVRFLAGKEGRFLKGWKEFSMEHGLLEGDVVVFHMLKPCYFKVYTVRANNPNAVQSANLTSLSVGTNEGNKKRKCEVAAPVGAVQETCRKSPLLLSSSDLAPGSSHSVRNDLLHSSDKSCRLSGSDADFENFNIIVNGETIGSELPEITRFKYYELCCSRGSHLHQHLLENVDRAFAASLITGTVRASDTIRNLKMSTSEKEFAMWGNTLESFEMFGMDVGFLIERLKRLASLRGSELGEDEEWKRYVETEKKRDCIVEEMKSLEAKLVGLKQATEKLEEEMKAVKVDVVKHKSNFQQEANAPWL